MLAGMSVGMQAKKRRRRAEESGRSRPRRVEDSTEAGWSLEGREEREGGKGEREKAVRR
jgi:hypothetical protein